MRDNSLDDFKPRDFSKEEIQEVVSYSTREAKLNSLKKELFNDPPFRCPICSHTKCKKEISLSDLDVLEDFADPYWYCLSCSIVFKDPSRFSDFSTEEEIQQVEKWLEDNDYDMAYLEELGQYIEESREDDD